MPARYCLPCNKWFRSNPPVKTCPDCEEVTKAQDRLSFAHVRAERHMPRSIDYQTSVPKYCLKHHTFGHWEGEGCLQPGAKIIFVVPSMKLHWKIPDEVVAELTKRPTPISKLEVMCHLQRLNEWTNRARIVVLARDRILRKIRSTIAQNLDTVAV